MGKYNNGKNITLIKNIVLDNIDYHFEFDTENENIYLYIPRIAIICKGSDVALLYPELEYMETGMLYPEILKFMNSKKAVRSINGVSDNKRFIPEPLSVSEDVYWIAYETDTDDLYLDIPLRNIRTDLLTVDVVFPELRYMHDGLLLEIVTDYVNKYGLGN